MLTTPQTTDQPVFSWLGVSGAATYEVWLTDGTTNKSQAIAGITGTSLAWPAAKALTPGDKFTWWVAAISTNGVANVWNNGQTFSVAALTAPAGSVLATPQSTDQPSFSWSAVPLAGSYVVWITDLKTNKSQTVTGIVGTSLTWPAAKALTPGDNFTWWVGAVSVNGQATAWSTGQSFGVAPLAAPVGLSTSGAQDQPTFSWTPVPDAGSYELWITDNTNNTAATYQMTTSSYTLSASQALKPGHNYTWWAATVSTNGLVILWSNGVSKLG